MKVGGIHNKSLVVLVILSVILPVALPNIQLPEPNQQDQPALTNPGFSGLIPEVYAATTEYYLGSTVEGSCSGKCEDLATTTGTADTTTSQSFSTSAPTKDTSTDAVETGTWSSGTSMTVGTVETAGSPDLIILWVVTYKSSSTITVSSVSDTASKITWQSSARESFTSCTATTQETTETEWYGVASSTITTADTITINLSGTPTAAHAVEMAVSGADTISPFDAGITPTPNTGCSSTKADPSSILTGTTVNANDIILSFYGGYTSTTETAGSSFTLAKATSGTDDSLALEYYSPAVTESSLSCTFGTTTTYWGAICDAVVGARKYYEIEPDVSSTTATLTPSVSTPSGYAWETATSLGGVTIPSGTWQFDMTVTASLTTGSPKGYIWLEVWSCSTISLGTCTFLLKNYDNSTNNVLGSTTATKYTYTTSSVGPFTSVAYLVVEYWLVLTVSGSTTPATASETTVSAASDVILPWSYPATFTSSGIGSDTGTATVVTVNSVNYAQSSLPYTAVAGAVTYSFASTVASTTTGKQYVFSSVSGCSQTSQGTTFTPSSSCTVTATYLTQYTITFTMNGHGTPSPVSGTWENSAAVVPVTISADGSNSSSTRYVVNTITGSGSGSFSTSTLGTTQFSVTMNAPITETVAWQTQYTLSFVANGYGSLSPASGTWENSGAVVAVVIGSDGSNSSTTRHILASVSGSGSGSFSGSTSGQTQFPVTMNAAIIETLSWTTQYTITFVMNSHGTPSPASGTWENSGAVVAVTIGADGSNSSSTRYVISAVTGSGSGSFSTSTSGTTQFSVTMNAPITETLTWTTQYYLTMASSPSAGGSVSPSSGWQNSGAVIASISATANGGYSFNGWTGTGTTSYTGSNNPCTNCVTMNTAISETANFLAAVVTINNRTLSVSSGGANMTAPQAVNPTTEYWFGTGLSDTASMTDINSVTIDLYRTGHTPGTFSSSFVYSFRWVANGWSGTPSCSTSPGCWQELQSSGWVAAGFNYLIPSDSSVTTIAGGTLTGEWQFALKLDQLAVYTTNGAGLWNFKVTGVSKAGGNPTGARAGTFDVNLLVSVTVPGNMNWGTVAAGSLNVTASGMPVYTTYTANAIVTITIYGGGDPTSQYGDSFPLSSIYVGKTSSPANNDGVVLSTSPTVIYSSLPVAANSNLAMYWFISTPNPFTPGTYTFAYYETIQLQSMQT